MTQDPSESDADLVLTCSLGQQPPDFFPTFLRELADGLGRAGLEWAPGAEGRFSEHGTPFGVVTGPETATELTVALRPVTWSDSPGATLRIRSDPRPAGSAVVVELRGWSQALDATGARLGEWVASALLPALLRQVAPGELGEWVMDQQARRPAGAASVDTYRDPTYHWPNFFLILDRLGLSRDDRLLEVGCGGGAFLRKALESGCSATGVDHSPEMVRLARDQNRASLESGRLEVRQGEADELPVDDGAFTKCVSTAAFPFFPDPRKALKEMYRALAGGGQLALFMDTAAARGTPAAPEPFASRGRFYEPNELLDLAREAGFSEIRVEEPNLGPFARAAGLPEETVKFFDGTGGGMLLLARRP